MSKSIFAALCLLAASILSAAPARAELPCGKWETSFGSLAGEGEALNTYFCQKSPDLEYEFEITCNAGNLNIRFMPQLEGEFGKVTLDYRVDGKSHLVQSQFEELDGAFAVDVEATDPLVKALKSGKSATVTLTKTKAPTYTVPLKGAGRALAKLVRKCK